MRVALMLLLLQDPTQELRRQELALRLSELADAEKLDGFARAVQRELRAPRVDASLFDECWRPIARRRWEGRLDALIAAWDQAAVDAPTPGRLLFRARLEDLATRPKACRDRLEEAVRRFPGEPLLLWHLATARFEAGDRGSAALALEELALVKGAVFDSDEFHCRLVTCYAETGRPAAAVEHLRAVRREEDLAVALARLASASKLPEEAARLYRIALQEEPERMSLQMGLVVALTAAGERTQAAAERSRLFLTDGTFSKSKMEDYFYRIPPQGRAEEIVRTLRDLREPSLPGLLGSVPLESRNPVMAEWERTIQDGRDWALLGRMKGLWVSESARIEILTQGESRYPKDPWIIREKIEALDRSEDFRPVADAYVRLVELDPDGRITGARPFELLTRALADLSLKDVPAAVPLGFRLLAEPGLDEKSARAARAAWKPGWDQSPVEFWAQMRKLTLPRPAKAVEQALRAQMDKLAVDDFQERTAATAELRKGGLLAIPVLLERIEDPDAEIRSRSRELIRSILTD